MSHAFDDMNEPELRAMFRELAEAVKSRLPAGTGFIVLAAPMGPGGIAQYVSNVQREDAAKWMVETVERWLAGDHVEREG